MALTLRLKEPEVCLVKSTENEQRLEPAKNVVYREVLLWFSNQKIFFFIFLLIYVHFTFIIEL